MTIIKKDEYVFNTHIEKTQKYYETHSVCDCAYCRNYYIQAKNKLPKLAAFLTEFGIDISKPDEIFSVESDGDILYINVDYTVSGSIEAMGESETSIYDNCFVSIIFTDGFASPNEQSGEYFTISVMQIQLPWVLDEPLVEPVKKKLAIKSFFEKY